MEDAAIKDILKGFGFSEKETGVYFALLELGPSVVSDIGKKAGINRSTAYVVIEALAKRGLVGVTERRGVKVYSSVPPERLLQSLEQTAQQYAELVTHARKILPKLNIKKSTIQSRPNVKIFEGSEGMKTVYEDSLTSLEVVRSYAFSAVRDKRALPDHYFDLLAKKNIKIKALFPETSTAEEFSTRGGVSNGKIRDFSPDISIYDNKIVFVSPEENFGLIIESKELADALKKAFDLSWKEARHSRDTSPGGAVSNIAGAK